MYSTYNYIRLIIEFIAGLVLVVFFFGLALVAAITVGLPMALGMGLVFLLAFLGSKNNK